MLGKELESELTRMVERVNGEAQATGAGSSSSKWQGIANSPFVVTVIGGLLLMILTTVWQRSHEDNQAALQKAEKLEERQYTTMVAFTDGMSRYLQAAPDIFYRKFFLAQNSTAENKGSLTFVDGRSWKDTVERYESGMVTLNGMPSPDSLCSQVSVMFRNTELVEAVRGFDLLMDRYVETYDLKEFERFQQEAVGGYQKVIDLMRLELVGK